MDIDPSANSSFVSEHGEEQMGDQDQQSQTTHPVDIQPAVNTPRMLKPRTDVVELATVLAVLNSYQCGSLTCFLVT